MQNRERVFSSWKIGIVCLVWVCETAYAKYISKYRVKFRVHWKLFVFFVSVFECITSTRIDQNFVDLVFCLFWINSFVIVCCYVFFVVVVAASSDCIVCVPALECMFVYNYYMSIHVRR